MKTKHAVTITVYAEGYKFPVQRRIPMLHENTEGMSAEQVADEIESWLNNEAFAND